MLCSLVMTPDQKLCNRPGWPNEPIEIELSVVDRGSPPPYYALSYVWGSQESPVIIQCKGIEMPVTRNLASALRAFRPLPTTGDASENCIRVLRESHVLHSSRQVWKDIARSRNEVDQVTARRAGREDQHIFFWIDAICINQDDRLERAAQVNGMRGIYMHARKVYIWFGDQLVSPDGSALQLPEMKTSKMDRRLGRVRLAELGHMPVVLGFLVQSLRNETLVSELGHNGGIIGSGFPEGSAPEYQILRAFFNQPWFSRVWIVQEAVLARSSSIVVGEWELDWVPFTRAVEILFSIIDMSTRFSFTVRFPYNTSRRVGIGLNLTPSRYIHAIQKIPTRTKDLLPLLLDSRTSTATNPADHVFAVLGISTEVADSDFPSLVPDLLRVDYSKCVGHVFRDATWFIILNHRTLRPLTIAELSEDREFPECPTWAPVWSQQRRTLSLYSEHYDASHGQVLQLEREPTEGLDFLRVAGHIFETVQQQTDPLPNISESEYFVEGWHYPPRDEDKAFVSQAWNIASLTTEGHDGTMADLPAAHTGAQTMTRPYRDPNEVLQSFLYTLVANISEYTESGRADSSEEMLRLGKIWLHTHLDVTMPNRDRLTRLASTLRKMVSFGKDVGFQVSFLRVCFGRRFFATQSGFFGIGPTFMRKGDVIAVILGLPVPIMLREVDNPTLDGKTYNIVGECYVHGIMDGEWVQARQDGGQGPEVLRLC